MALGYVPTPAPRDSNSVPLTEVATSTTTATKTNNSTTVPVKIVATATPCRKVVICAYVSNADVVAIGDTNAVAESLSSPTKTGQGYQMTQGSSQTFYVADASLLYLAVASAGDGVSISIFY